MSHPGAPVIALSLCKYPRKIILFKKLSTPRCLQQSSVIKNLEIKVITRKKVRTMAVM